MPPDIDDGSIPDDAGLLRRIRPDQVVPDENLGGLRPSSAAFKDLEMSVDAEPILVANGQDWRFTLQGYAGYSLARFVAHKPRSLGLPVIHKPQDKNPAHTEVHGKKTRSNAREIADSSQWVHLEPKKP